jgi:hypothetical protein
MWIICSIFPELNDEGEVIEMIGCCTDIRYVRFRSFLFECLHVSQPAEMGRESPSYTGMQSS